MISNALQISVQEKKGGVSKGKFKKPPLLHSSNIEKTQKKAKKNHSFSHLLFSNLHNTQPQRTNTQKNTQSLNAIQTNPNARNNIHKKLMRNSQDILKHLSKNPAKQKTKSDPLPIPTQTQLKMQEKTQQTQPKSSTQLLANQLKETSILAKSISTKQEKTKTLRDIQKIAQSQELNLSKIEIQHNTEKTKKRAKTPQLQNPKKLTIKTKEKQLVQKSQYIAQKDIKQQEHLLPKQDSQPSQTIQTNQEDKIHQEQQRFKNITLASLLSQNPKEKSIQTLEEKQEEKKSEKTQDILIGDLKKETQFKIAQSKETITHFSNRLREEILNYKPPFTKLSMELNPQELGKLEVTITKKGKELQISVNANNPNALQTFIQNQNDFRNTLSSIGFNSVELSFSQGDGQKQQKQNQDNQQKGNKNSLSTSNETSLATAMEIKMVQYA